MIVENWVLDFAFKVVGFIAIVIALGLFAWWREMRKSGKL